MVVMQWESKFLKKIHSRLKRPLFRFNGGDVGLIEEAILSFISLDENAPKYAPINAYKEYFNTHILKDGLVEEFVERVLLSDKVADPLHLLMCLPDYDGFNWFEQFVVKGGKTAVERIMDECSSNASRRPQLYVDALLEVHRKNLEEVRERFKGDGMCLNSLDAACRRFVNDNALANTSSASAQLISEHVADLSKCDDINKVTKELGGIVSPLLFVTFSLQFKHF
jgi:hypothetical protein